LVTAPAGAAAVVLDTAPAPGELISAVARFPGNTLLAGVVAKLTAPGHWHDALGPAPVVLKAQQRACGAPAPYAPYLMADHGLFVAGIIHDIAPACDLTIVRVLNRWGVGYLSDLLAGLARVIAARPLVVNMSLTVRMPTHDELYAQLSGSRDRVVSDLLDAWRNLLPDASAPLVQVLQLLSSSSVFLVAATGNDSGNGPLADPCVPAAFDTTLGVAAVDQFNQRACYSNRADDRASEGDAAKNGIATLGGVPGNAVHGLYSAPSISLPGTTAANPSGWAQWMGTSFATPVIAGLAANYLANNPAASPDQVMQALRKHGVGADPTLHAQAIVARQVCS
jgi:subtilisin family serine protease